ncbi:hypothetical protein EYF80_033475 [Liparis tanakae]|uniref:Uncharacterized protein n=1 Tax=Liparis tanakae TaxID=230148 RepID=A0A4Z2GSA6_9TELE|nr:hypothetical protein EYF80_033475 [Liparis tanakae]
MAATASSWQRNSTSASPVDFPLGATSMWTLRGLRGEKNCGNKGEPLLPAPLRPSAGAKKPPLGPPIMGLS